MMSKGIFSTLLCGSCIFFLMSISAAARAQRPKSSSLSTGYIDVEAHAPLSADTPARPLHYRPQNGSFVKVSGTRRFNRALYGTHTAFRIEGGDLPEFSFYLPGMGGNIRLIIMRGHGKSARAIWLTGAKRIQTTFDAGHLKYCMKDALLGKGQLQIDLYALASQEGAIFSINAAQIPSDCQLFMVYGGASAKRFSRNGDIGADPESSFYFKRDACLGNTYDLSPDHGFKVRFSDHKKKTTRTIQGFFPKQTRISLLEADLLTRENIQQIQTDPSVSTDLLNQLTRLDTRNPHSNSNHQNHTNSQQKIDKQQRKDSTIALQYPALIARVPLKNHQTVYATWLIRQQPLKDYSPNATTVGADAQTFKLAKAAAESLGNRLRIHTPDPYINALGGVLSAAADAIWEAPTFLHGAVAWRMRLPAWRGPYAGDALGWHKRAKLHFTSYAKSQVISPERGPVVFDSSRNHARQLEKMGTAMFSAGYICRNPDGKLSPHHYDMNLVYIDELIQHFNYTGDSALLRSLWPVVTRSLAWENRNFDPDGDGLYDAYACIWASDALQYSGGAVTHSTAYNYRANQMAARLAKVIGSDPAPYQKKANQIKKAMNQQLWLPKYGIFAEYKDYAAPGHASRRNLHRAPGLWTVYHSLDAGLATPFQASQLLRYVDTKIPHIPVRVNGMDNKNSTHAMYLLSTTNWQPYTWSVNNVALAENLQMALGYWQGNRPEAAYQLWRSALIESMYMGASPGGFEQLSYYDARRGELYRDFGDPIGMAARSLMEGLFGFRPSAMTDTLVLRPGLPADWPYAHINSPDIDFSFTRKGLTDQYNIYQHYPKSMRLKFQIPVLSAKVAQVKVNGKAVDYQLLETIGHPTLQLRLPSWPRFDIQITWAGAPLGKKTILVSDAASVLRRSGKTSRVVDSGTDVVHHYRQQRLEVVATGTSTAVQITGFKDPQGVIARITDLPERGGKLIKIKADKDKKEGAYFVHLQKGALKWWQAVHYVASKTNSRYPEDWFTENIHATKPLDISASFNDQVTHIFKKQYVTPRAETVSLQLPLQGVGNWCYPTVQPHIDDQGLRRRAGKDNRFSIGDSLAFTTPFKAGKNNILFVSKWDCYPNKITIPLHGRAAGIAVMMAGTTNPMQSQMENGALTVQYLDGTTQKIPLRNPETWWPIEQDYYNDHLAFTLKYPPPIRVHLKTGKVTHGLTGANDYQSIKGYSDRVIDGGAATVLQWKIDPDKKLKSITVSATASEVVIGLMSLSLINPLP